MASTGRTSRPATRSTSPGRGCRSSRGSTRSKWIPAFRRPARRSSRRTPRLSRSGKGEAMASLRTHDVVLAEGTFRVVLTEKRRVLAVLDAPTTALGPLHIVLAGDREPYLAEGVSPLVLTQRPTVETAGLFDDLGHAVSHAVSHASEGAFNAVSHAATAIARPAFNLVKAASSEGVHLLAHTIPFLPDRDRRKLDAAARTVMRAKLGDLDAKQFIRGIADAAKAGEHAAMHIGDTLMDASK